MELCFKVIGYPVKHSLSPWIHEQFLRKANLEGTYTINEIEPASFEEEIYQMKENPIDGFNVTVPYKQKIIPFLDGIDAYAEKIGAVNTVVNKAGKWIGYNTDGIGYLRSLEAKYPSVLENRSGRILIIGAGGAARGIYYALDEAGFRAIDLTNRTAAKANELIRFKNKETKSTIILLKDVKKYLEEYDLVIQTTSVGMKPNINDMIVSIPSLKPQMILSDIVYQPIRTSFLRQGEAKGANIHFGHTMLLYQAQLAFEIWTGVKVPIGNMDQDLQQILEGR
ncbi:shikimate dehydrogenase [Oceanobacillus bengalensis]|uniref:Shikimate dehydrogenase (NADP(+)) n=1 Tax=Oceanobacillus bengalensis TaxID=1435466 RepID=A0A494Z5R4_9BACI|nr:shikimate dehydrogenase [Oceanobacillus bengalensis]RKQ17878.1 shikimate dehydrogenase [Oceanobacillus bengalensis]